MLLVYGTDYGHTMAKYPIKPKLLQLKLIHIFARAILLMKKVEIEKTKPTFTVSVLNVEY